MIKSTLNKKYIFRPGFINPGRKTAFSGVALMLYRVIYKVFPALGVGSINLAKVMVQVGVTGREQVIFENRDLREIAINIQ